MKEKKLSLIMALLIFFCMPLYINASIPAEINDSGVRIRSGAGTNTSIIATVNSGTAISLVNTTLHTGTGCSAGWYNITYNKQGVNND